MFKHDMSSGCYRAVLWRNPCTVRCPGLTGWSALPLATAAAAVAVGAVVGVDSFQLVG